MLGFFIVDIMDSLFDDIVVDLSSSSSKKGYIRMISSFSSLFSFGRTVGLTHEREVLWEPQKGNNFLHIQTLNPQYQVIQQRQDINSMGT